MKHIEFKDPGKIDYDRDTAYKEFALQLVKHTISDINSSKGGNLGVEYNFLIHGLGRNIIDYFNIEATIIKKCPRYAKYRQKQVDKIKVDNRRKA